MEKQLDGLADTWKGQPTKAPSWLQRKVEDLKCMLMLTLQETGIQKRPRIATRPGLRHGYIILYEGCPTLTKSQLQGEIALSSTESEYNGLSYALRDAIPIMELLKEMKQNGFKVGSATSKVHCKVFEDNSGALEMAKIHKHRPRTKHLNVKLHHFRSHVDTTKEVTIHKIDTKNQPADVLTKPLNEKDFVKFRKWLLGW